MINIKGKMYVTVAERVNMAHEKKADFQIVESTPLSFGDRILWRVVIQIAGKQFIGHAEAKMNAAKNLPDGTNPFECAETSALGRALGFAGLGSVESIASAEEVIQAMAEQERHAPKPTYNNEGPATEQQLDTIDRLRAQLGMQSLESTDGLSFGDCAAMLRDLNKRLQSIRKAG